MKVAYTPIDIEFDSSTVDKVQLLSFIKNNYVKDLEYTSKLAPIVVRHKVNDWRSKADIFGKDVGYKLSDNYKLYYAPGIEETFPTIVKLLDQLPYKQLIGACFNLHQNPLYPHQDENDTNMPQTPERYNVLLTEHFGQDSFFVAKTRTSEKVYPTILKEAPVYSFDNRNFYHGADPVLDNRVILVCSGILDDERHKELIRRSSEKYKNYVIKF